MITHLIIGKVTGTERLTGSRNGNPRFKVAIHVVGERADLHYKTAVDSGLAYGITNPEYKNSEHVFAIDGRSMLVGAHPLNDAHVADWVNYQLDIDTKTAKVIADARRAAEVYGEDTTEQPNATEHSPVNWFTLGVYPSCSCGYAPANNRALIKHWAEHGLSWHAEQGTLVAEYIS